MDIEDDSAWARQNGTDMLSSVSGTEDERTDANAKYVYLKTGREGPKVGVVCVGECPHACKSAV